MYVAKDAVDRAQDVSLSINAARSQGVSRPRGVTTRLLRHPRAHMLVGVSLRLYH